MTVTGEYLNMIEQIVFDGITLTGFNVADDARSLSFVLPSKAADGEFWFVDYAGEKFLAGEFASIKPCDIVVEPSPVKAGEELTISGNHLDLVSWIDVPGAGQTDFSFADGKITLIMPGKAVDTEGAIGLYMENGACVAACHTLVKPTITEVSPLEIYAGDELTVTGTDLDLIVSATLGGKEVELIPSDGSESLKLATAATSVSGVVELKLENGTSILGEQEVTVSYHSKVIVTSIPAGQHIGQPVSIKGTNLALVETIYIGDTKVTNYQLRTDEQMVFTMPWCKAGFYEVKFVLYDGDTEVQADPIEVQLEQTFTTIAEGEFIADAWGNQPYIGPDQGGVTYNIKAGDVLRLYFEPIRDESDWKVQIVEGHWGPTYASICKFGADTEGGKFVETDYIGYYDLTVTAEMATAFATQQWWGGLILLNGDNVKGTKLELLKTISQETTIWEGEAIADAWGNQPYIFDDASGPANGIVEGVTLKFYLERIRPDEGWKLQVVEGHWGPTYCSYCSVGEDTESGKFVETDKSFFTLPVDAAMAEAAALQQWWGGVLLFNGNNTKVTKITIL